MSIIIDKYKRNINIMQSPRVVDKLLSQEMSRRDFLKHLSIGALLILGGNTIVQALLESNTALRSQKNSLGYGSSAYGGSSAPRMRSE